MVKNPPADAGDVRDVGLIPGSGRSPGGGHGNLLLPGAFHGQRRLVGYMSIGSQRVRHDWSNLAHKCFPKCVDALTYLAPLYTHTHTHTHICLCVCVCLSLPTPSSLYRYMMLGNDIYDWGLEEKGVTEDDMVGWHHWLNREDFEQTSGGCVKCKPGMLESMGLQGLGHDWANDQHI